MIQTRFLRHALAVGAAVIGFAALPATATAQKHGDVNGDGAVSALDAQAILTAVVGLPLPAGYIIANGVAVCDGRTVPAALDAQIVLSFVIGLNVSQYCVGAPSGPGATTITLLAGTAAVPDTTLLINRGIWLRATLKDANGSTILRPVAWSNSATDIVSLDTIRRDSAFVKAKAIAGPASITATSDGANSSIGIRVFTSYAGIVITPQRGDTIRQLNASKNFTARNRDSLGVISGFPQANWTIGNTAIGSVPATASNTGVVTALSLGSTFLYAQSTTNPAVKDSVPLVVALPPVNTCVAGAGSLHSNQTYTTPQTWTAATNPHFVSGSLTFNSGSKLTIDPGVVVCLNGGANMLFHAGSRMTARGTVASPITFTLSTSGSAWSNIQFGDNTSYSGSAPADTSVVTNALVERGGSGAPMLNGREQHALIVDSVRLRAGAAGLVRVNGPGSRLSRSTVDTVAVTSGNTPAVFVGRGLVEVTTIRNGANGGGIQITDAGIIRNVTIIGGQQGLSSGSSVSGVKVNDVTISGTATFAIDLQTLTVDQTSANVVVSGGAGGAFRGQIGNLGYLFPDSLKQETLKNNGKDSLFITGGTLTRATVVARPDLPWLVTSTVTVDTLGQLAPRPGARFGFQNSSFTFTSGGTIDARGEGPKIITFNPSAGGNFFGLQFNNPGAAANPANNPVATSTLQFVRLDSMSGVSTPAGGLCANSCQAGIMAGDRHIVVLDNAVIHKAWSGAVYLNTPGSQITNTTIDTTGMVSSGYTANSAAIALGKQSLLQNVLVRRSGQIGIHTTASPTSDTTTRLQNVRVVASLGVGLQAEQGILAGDFGSVRIDSANAYPFRGSIQNFATLVRDSVSQLKFLGNATDVAVITGGTVHGTPGVHTPASPMILEAIPGLRWQVESYSTFVDTLAQLKPRAGTQFTFYGGALHFQRGGTLNAVGQADKIITFKPLGTGYYFYGLAFYNPGPDPNPANSPTAISTMQYVRVDSAGGISTPTGGICANSCSAAIITGDHHRLLIDHALVRRPFSGAVYVNTPGSTLTNSTIDTTGTIETGFTANSAALGLGKKILVQNTIVRASGQTGIHTYASPATDTTARFQNVRVVASRGVGLQAEQGVLEGDLGSVLLDSANAYPFRGTIQNFAMLATDSVSQLKFTGNATDVAVITGGSVHGTPGVHTPGSPLILEAIPGLRWQVESYNTVIDTLAQLVARPGSQFTFYSGALHFQRGGTLNAVGEPDKIIWFKPLGQNYYFYGLAFYNPGPDPNPANSPTAISTMQYVRVDSAGGVSTPTGGICANSCSAAVTAGDHHRLLIDHALVRRPFSGAVYVNTPGSILNNTVVDTTGTIETGFTANSAALALGKKILAQNTIVRASGQTGIHTYASPATDTTARFQNVRVVASRGVGLQAEQGVLEGDMGSILLDSANAYPFRGTIQNFAMLALDSVAQAGFTGNATDVVVITGGTLRGDPIDNHEVPRRLAAIPNLRWQVESFNTIIDTLAQLAARPGTQFTFYSGALIFQRGGTLDARGEADKIITFSPLGTGYYFYGLQFNNPGPAAAAVDNPVATSFLSYVRVDSAGGVGSPSGGICANSCSAAINAGDRHILNIDNAIVRKSFSGAVYLGGHNSSFTNSSIDTTGTIESSYVANSAALALNDTVTLSNVTVRRSGREGIHIQGTQIDFSNVRVVRSLSTGIQVYDNSATGGSRNLTLSNFAVDSAGGVGVSVEASGVQLLDCDVLSGASHGIITANSYTGLGVHQCNIEGNAGKGVSNFQLTDAQYIIDADTNFWAAIRDGTSTPPTTTDPNNGITTNVTVANPSSSRFHQP